MLSLGGNGIPAGSGLDNGLKSKFTLYWAQKSISFDPKLSGSDTDIFDKWGVSVIPAILFICLHKNCGLSDRFLELILNRDGIWYEISSKSLFIPSSWIEKYIPWLLVKDNRWNLRSILLRFSMICNRLIEIISSWHWYWI